LENEGVVGVLVDGWVRENAKKASIQLKIDEWVEEKDERRSCLLAQFATRKKPPPPQRNATWTTAGKICMAEEKECEGVEKGKIRREGGKCHQSITIVVTKPSLSNIYLLSIAD